MTVRGFWSELRRRHVVRVAAGYVVAGAAVGAVASDFLPGLGAPEWVLRTVLGLLVLGLPVALAIAWAYDVTPEGVERTGPPPGRGDRSRLAILPLANIHADREQDYFAEGMTEELISVTSRISGLDVIARTSVLGYRDTTKPISEIGRELGVGTVLEGSVRKAGDQLRITVQLIDAETQGHLWSNDYDRKLDDVFRIQSDIARQVADALEVALLGSEETRLDTEPTTNLEAYDLYLLGRHEFNKRNEAGVRKAIEHFHASTRLDDRFAVAYAALADAYVYAGHGYASIPDAFRYAKEAAVRALELDETLPEAHRSLGYATAYRDWDLDAADLELQRAIELNPSDAQAHQWYSHHAIFQRRFADAIPRIERAHELDPLSVVIQNERGWPRFFLGDLDEAMECFERAAAMEGGYAMAYYNMGNVDEAQGRTRRAIERYRKAVELSNRSPLIVSALGAALARAGERAEARELLEEIQQQMAAGTSLWIWKASILDALGEKQETLDCIERGVEAKESPAMLLDSTHFWFRESMGDDPTFRALLQKVDAILGLASGLDTDVTQ